MDKSLLQLKKLITDGKPTFGVFDRVEEINYLDYHSYKLSNKAVANWRKKLRANQFCFLQITAAPYRVCFAVATLNWVTSSFCYLYNEETDELELVEALQPFTRNTQFNQSTYKDKISFKSKKLSIELDFKTDTIDVVLNSKIFNLKARITRGFDSLSVCTQTGKKGWTYTQKEPMLVQTGTLTSHHVNQDLKGANAFLDWSVGYMRRVTNWYWTSITTNLPTGVHFAMNLATGVNESGASENACWVDGVRYHLPAVMFKRGDTIKEDWLVSNQALNWSKVKINLSFTPVNCYQKSDRLVVVDSIFEQWLGYYSGTIELDDGNVIRLDKVMGLAEDHYAKW
ncbi:DUF2804 domain-containing protein [Psychrobacter sp. HD31]|uniref:DUF2804 domain-containing protein n=1 Tax=Psychrobacter sp. HD31 TaxID=3112003 RepID=UPI003DA54C85